MKQELLNKKKELLDNIYARLTAGKYEDVIELTKKVITVDDELEEPDSFEGSLKKAYVLVSRFIEDPKRAPTPCFAAMRHVEKQLRIIFSMTEEKIPVFFPGPHSFGDVLEALAILNDTTNELRPFDDIVTSRISVMTSAMYHLIKSYE